MYVCVCHGLRCRDVREAARSGKACATEVFDHFEVLPRCGKCLASMSSLLATEASNANIRPGAMPACSGERLDATTVA